MISNKIRCAKLVIISLIVDKNDAISKYFFNFAFSFKHYIRIWKIERNFPLLENLS